MTWKVELLFPVASDINFACRFHSSERRREENLCAPLEGFGVELEVESGPA